MKLVVFEKSKRMRIKKETIVKVCLPRGLNGKWQHNNLRITYWI